MKQIEFFGYTLENKTVADIANLLSNNENPTLFSHVVTLNPTIFIQSELNKRYKSLIQRSNLIVVDGIGLKWAIKLLTKVSVHIVTGVDLCYYLLQHKQSSCYLLGAKPDVIENVVNNIKLNYQKISIVGYHHGYFSKEEFNKICTEVKASSPDFIFIATGFPYQEEIINALRDYGCTGTAIGIGGVFDVLSGNVKLAPQFIRKYNLEWLYRSLQDVRRLPRLKYLVYFTFFIFGRLVINLLRRCKNFFC